MGVFKWKWKMSQYLLYFYLPYCELTFGMFVAIWTFHFIYTVFFWPIRINMLYIHYINSWKVKFIHKVIPASYWHLHLIFFITYLTENIPNLVLIWERERRTIIQVWYKSSNVLLSHFISFWYWYIISKFGLVFRCVIFTAQ